MAPRSSYPPPREPLTRRRALWSLAAVIVLLAAGAGAFLLIRHPGGHQTAQSDGLSTSAAGNTSVAPTQPASSPTASPQISLSPSAPPSPSPSVSPSVVSTSPQVGTIPAPVEEVISRYFEGINDHDYAEYATAETARGLQDQPASSFAKGYATTVDSGMTLTSLASTGQGDLTAAVSFTSRQSPADSVDHHSGCDNWALNLYLVPNGSGYLIAPAPPGYEPTHTDC